MASARHDVIILGGGLAGGLAALALKLARPSLRLALVEPGEKIGGNHLWSFFESDIEPSDRWLTDPLIVHQWPKYEVRFPQHSRTIDQAYRTIESERLDSVVRSALAEGEVVRATAVSVASHNVVLDDGQKLTASAVLDARGLSKIPGGLTCGWQKFAGRLLEVPAGHGIATPIVMDATVEQLDGYRFVYALPFSPTQIFVEDTYYADQPKLDRDLLGDRIAEYANSHGWQIAGVSREEFGVLPVVMGGNFDRFWPAEDGVARAGVRGGFFHPLTSYSLPDAVRFASWLASSAPLDERLSTATRERAKQHWRSGRFDRLLARMLFRAARPAQRFRVLERFYRLPAPLISRFYAGRSTFADRARILAGKPPVPVGNAIRAMLERT